MTGGFGPSGSPFRPAALVSGGQPHCSRDGDVSQWTKTSHPRHQPNREKGFSLRHSPGGTALVLSARAAPENHSPFCPSRHPHRHQGEQGDEGDGKASVFRAPALQTCKGFRNCRRRKPDAHPKCEIKQETPRSAWISVRLDRWLPQGRERHAGGSDPAKGGQGLISAIHEAPRCAPAQHCVRLFYLSRALWVHRQMGKRPVRNKVQRLGETRC